MRISERRIHALLGISRTGQRYKAKPKPQDHLAEPIKALSAEHHRYGQNRVWALLRASDQEGSLSGGLGLMLS